MTNMIRSRTCLLLLLTLSVMDSVSHQAEPVGATPERPTPPRRSVPTPEEKAWVDEHLLRNIDVIASDYPIPEVHDRFVRAAERIRQGQVLLNIDVNENSASADAVAMAYIEGSGRLCISFFLPRLRRLAAELSPEAFQDQLVLAVLHEFIHLEEQRPVRLDETNRSLSEYQAMEADASCKTAERVLRPMRAAGRPEMSETDKQALAVLDEVGDACHDPKWLAFGRIVSPRSPGYNYSE